MESSFISDDNFSKNADTESIQQRSSGRFEFQKVRSFGALYFVKRPSKAYRHDLLTLESLNKEFHIVRNLDHPSIVKYIKMENDAVFEEYIDGLSLKEMIDSNDIRLRSPNFIKRICRNLLETTAYLHNHRVIHNDIKPGNVMITRIGEQVKLVDFGCATTDMWDAAEGFTPGYKAPEQGVEATNIYTDIFLVGKLMEQLAPLAGVSSEWEDFINRATCKIPKFRFSSDLDAIRAIPKGKWKDLVHLIIFLLLFLLFIGGFNYLTSDFEKWFWTRIFSFFGAE